MFKPYEETLDRKKMDKKTRCAYEAFCGLKARSKKAGFPPPSFGAREFIGWWLFNLETFKGTRPTCGRIDHSRGYSFENIEMQDMSDNSREMNARTDAVFREVSRGKKVYLFDKSSGELVEVIPSIRAAAERFGVSQRLMQFLVRGQYRQSHSVPFDVRGAA